ncbi:hypothetical protein [Sphingomonas sp. NFX23]|uniref:hypothetical protein n=1 Tax=Sphingomonas sp. NFX23 TaxID=2819532 RepID=UPI003CF0270B
MSIFKDLLAFVDDKLEATYSHKAYDPSADRARVAKRVMAQKEKFASATPVKGSKDFSIANGIVRYEPKLPNGSALKLGDKSAPFHIPSEKFDAFLTKLHSVIVDQKGIDDQLSATPTGDKLARAPRKASTGGTGGAGWSDERRAKFAATMAARKNA